jgi:hypothetical protein
MMSEIKLDHYSTKDMLRGCPVKAWDGPYSYRCGGGPFIGSCARHGEFESVHLSEQEQLRVDNLLLAIRRSPDKELKSALEEDLSTYLSSIRINYPKRASND